MACGVACQAILNYMNALHLGLSYCHKHLAIDQYKLVLPRRVAIEQLAGQSGTHAECPSLRVLLAGDKGT